MVKKYYRLGNGMDGGWYGFPGSEYTDVELEFLRAVAKWRQQHRGGYPDYRDVLKILHELGYRRLKAATNENEEFRQAIQDFKAAKRRPNPFVTEVLHIARELGYRKETEGNG